MKITVIFWLFLYELLTIVHFRYMILKTNCSCKSSKRIKYLTLFQLSNLWEPLIYLSIICFASILFSCSSNPEKVNISGKFEAHLKKTFLINEFFGDSIKTVDSIKTNRNGKFSWNRVIHTPTVFSIIEKESKASVFVFVYPGEQIILKSTGIYFHNVKIKGSKSSIFLNQMNSRLLKVKNQLDSLTNIYRVNSGDTKFDSIKTILDSTYIRILKSHKNYSRQLISANIYSPLSAIALFQRYDSLHSVFNSDSDFKYFDMVDTSLLSVYPDNSIVKSFHKKVCAIRENRDILLQRNRMLKVGELFPDVPFILHNGEEFRILGRWFRLLLINFKSAECKKCITDSELKYALRSYGYKGLIVLQVNINLQNSNDKFVPIIDTIGFYNSQITLDINADLLDKLNISSLPANYLTDRRSNIRATNLNYQEFQDKLKVLLP